MEDLIFSEEQIEIASNQAETAIPDKEIYKNLPIPLMTFPHGTKNMGDSALLSCVS